jgi:hypothetical protein
MQSLAQGRKDVPENQICQVPTTLLVHLWLHARTAQLQSSYLALLSSRGVNTVLQSSAAQQCTSDNKSSNHCLQWRNSQQNAPIASVLHDN